MIAWFTGPPAAGKTTLARRVRSLVEVSGTPSVLLDSDELRIALDMRGYGPAERDAFYRALGELALLLERQGLVVLVAATAARRRYRDDVRARAHDFLEIHVRASLDEREARDVKGLYAAARAGDAPELPGAGVAYEEPLAPDVVAEGGFDEAAAIAIAAVAGTRPAPGSVRAG